MTGFYGQDYADPYDPGPADNPADRELEQQIAFNQAVAEELRRLRIRKAAAERLTLLERGDRPTIYARNGAEFILDTDHTQVPALWGSGTDVLCANGEPLMIVGGPGVGKTTLGGQLLEARVGLGDGRVLGMPVEPTATRVLYLAMDRPRQIQRALARLFTEEDRDALTEHLVFWPGPPPADLAQDTDTLARLAHEHGADTVIVDSLKDAFLGIADDEKAAGYNRARQTAIAAGVELIELHHNRKNTTGGTKVMNLSDVYGSRWLTAGAGSVIALNGDPGDAIVELVHLKQPADTVGPWKILHDNITGRSSVFHAIDLVALARAHGDITAKDAAKALADTDKPDPNQVEKARRRLDALAKSGHLLKYDHGDKATNRPTRWVANHLGQGPSDPSRTPSRTPSEREPITTPSRPSRHHTKPQASDHHGYLHDLHAAGPSRTHTPLEGVGVSPSPTEGLDLDAILGEPCPNSEHRNGHRSDCPERTAS